MRKSATLNVQELIAFSHFVVKSYMLTAMAFTEVINVSAVFLAKLTEILVGQYILSNYYISSVILSAEKELKAKEIRLEVVELIDDAIRMHSHHLKSSQKV